MAEESDQKSGVDWPRFYRYHNALFMREEEGDVGRIYVGKGEYKTYSDPDYRTFGERIDDSEAKVMKQQIDQRQ